MEEIEKVREMIGELSDKINNMIGKVSKKEIDIMMYELADLNEYEILVTNRRRTKRK